MAPPDSGLTFSKLSIRGDGHSSYLIIISAFPKGLASLESRLSALELPPSSKNKGLL